VDLDKDNTVIEKINVSKEDTRWKKPEQRDVKK
jgi:hypothetical protein